MDLTWTKLEEQFPESHFVNLSIRTAKTSYRTPPALNESTGHNITKNTMLPIIPSSKSHAKHPTEKACMTNMKNLR